MFTILEAGEREIFIQRVAQLTNESVDKIQELLPVWESIILGSSLKLIRNRIRFNALYNFIHQKAVPSKEIEIIFSSPAASVNWEKIISYGEGLFGILMPDKKSAIALLVSRELKCKSSLVVKGLSICFAMYGNRLKVVDLASMKDWNSFGEHFFAQKHDFSTLCPPKLQGQISEILLLSDVFKHESSSFPINTDEIELNADEEGSSSTNWKMIGLILGSIMLASVIAWFVYAKMTKEDEVVSADTEEIIPIDSLAKLRDSLTKLSADSARIASDSLTHLSWPDGKAFDVPKTSTLVPMFEYLTDTTNTESSELRVSEISFDAETNQLVSPFDAFFKKMAEGLNKYRDVQIRIFAFAENDSKSALKRGFVVKNRLVGEGVSPNRIEVKASGNNVNPEASVPINSQILLVLSKKAVLK
ncbi:hypothetical protein EWU23_00840 [Cytophagaceae bacterium 50C-KIRBA]|uniref:OmpA-like domain-containing protein n=1 Tax=Aquirufa beregesia TaxID=2516556 RepID=A0ABX0ERL8_9BACT|nr:hypothetical protein [Aquirufa beregesia]NGZ43016.1 hypothetical protein [Aquirufa beregesia]